jgi:hypothetical protein
MTQPVSDYHTPVGGGGVQRSAARQVVDVHLTPGAQQRLQYTHNGFSTL